MKTVPSERRSQSKQPAPQATARLPEAFNDLKCTDRAAREEILHRAYAMWQSEGQPENRTLEHWLAAEAEVIVRPGAMEAGYTPFQKH